MDKTYHTSSKFQTEQQGKLETDQFKFIFHTNPIPSYIWQHNNSDFILIDYNEAALSITNGEIINYLGIKASKLYRENPKIFNELLECFKKKTKIERSMSYKYKSTGIQKHLSVKYSYIPPNFVIVYTLDISNWKFSETALKELEDKYQKFIEKTQDGIVIFQTNSAKIFFASPAISEILQYSLWELKAFSPKELKNLIHPEDKRSFLKNFRIKFQNQKTWRYESLRLLRKDHTIKWTSISFSKINYRTEPCILAIVKDISERHKAKEQLTKINQCLLSFGSDSNENICKLTKLCNELMGGTYASYYRLDYGILCTNGPCNALPDYHQTRVVISRLCHDIIEEGSARLWGVKNLFKSKYPNKYHKIINQISCTYVGMAVKCEEKIIGVLCVIYLQNYIPSPAEEELFGIIVSALGVEEVRLKAKRALQKSEETAKALLNASDSIEILIKRDGTILALNEAAANSLEKNFNEISNWLQHATFISSETETLRKIKLDEVLSLKKPIRFEEHRKEKWFYTTFYPIVDETGDVYRVAVYAHDITDEKKAKEEILRISKAIESSSDAIEITDVDGKLIYRNSAMVKLSGYSNNKRKKMESPADFYDNPEAAKEIFRKVRTGESWKGYVRLKTYNGDLKPVALRADAVKDDHNHVIGLIGIYRDISDRIKAQKQKELFLKQLAEAEKLATLGQLAAAVAHEINNPLDIISTKIFLLEKNLSNYDIKTDIRELIKKINQQITRMSNLTNDILNYAKPISITYRSVNINTLLKKLIDLLSDQFPDTIELKLHLDENIFLIHGDTIGLELVFKNMILNALDALTNRTKGKIVISSKNIYKDMIKVTIKDNGIGIPEKNSDKIFEVFFTTKLKTGGTGLGLTICQKIIKQHNGSIQLTSKFGKGTRFDIYLPIRNRNFHFKKGN